jgi:hypothetical protein
MSSIRRRIISAIDCDQSDPAPSARRRDADDRRGNDRIAWAAWWREWQMQHSIMDWDIAQARAAFDASRA